MFGVYSENKGLQIESLETKKSVPPGGTKVGERNLTNERRNPADTRLLRRASSNER